jgi:hypothetical protein
MLNSTTHSAAKAAATFFTALLLAPLALGIRAWGRYHREKTYEQAS